MIETKFELDTLEKEKNPVSLKQRASSHFCVIAMAKLNELKFELIPPTTFFAGSFRFTKNVFS